MRFIVAIVSFVIAFLMISYGIAQRTVLAEPDHVAAVANISTDARVTVIPGKVLTAIAGRQKVQIVATGTIFAAYARTTDVLGWVGDAQYNQLGIDLKTSRLTSKVVGSNSADVPDPHGSDLWLGEYTRDNGLTFIVNVPANVSVIIMSDGKTPAPGQISITWPVDNRTPWSGPLIVGGVILLLIGLALYLWALSHLRKLRGPRRRPPKMPKAPRQLKSRQPKRKAITATKGRRSISRMSALTPMVLIGTLTLAGCSADHWPDLGGGVVSPSPTPATTLAPEPAKDEKPPVVTVPQLESIVAKIAAVAQKADADRNVAALSTRFTGPALALRTANYAIRGVDASYAAPQAIPSGQVEVTLPQQNDTWPRTVFTVVKDATDDKVAPTALMLVQDTARDNYKVVYAMALTANAPTLKTAPAAVGTQRLNPDVKVLAIPPSQLATEYGDILLKGDASTYYKLFDIANDPLEKSIGAAAKAARLKTLPAIASMQFANVPGAADVIAMASNDSGAIVAVYLTETETVKPVEAGAVINAEGAVKSLSGISTTTKGTVATYGDQLLFYVPPLTSEGKIIILGWASALVAAKEL